MRPLNFSWFLIPSIIPMEPAYLKSLASKHTKHQNNKTKRGREDYLVSSLARTWSFTRKAIEVDDKIFWIHEIHLPRKPQPATNTSTRKYQLTLSNAFLESSLPIISLTPDLLLSTKGLEDWLSRLLFFFPFWQTNIFLSRHPEFW